MKPRIVVVGSSNTDMIVKVPRLPSPGETVLGHNFQIVNGGKGANQAVAAARAGGVVTFITCVGDDTFGKRSLEFYKSEGIDVSCIKKDNQVASGVALINVAESGENSISVAPGANSSLKPEDISKNSKVLQSADMILLQLEIPLETIYKTIEIAAEKKVPVILNPAPAPDIKLEERYLKMVSFITPNQHEAAKLASAGDPLSNKELIENLQNMGLKTVLITLGESGVLFSENGIQQQQEGYKVEVADTTAAGDTFNGYLAVSLARGEKLQKAVMIANRAASISVTKIGASTSIPYLSEISL